MQEILSVSNMRDSDAATIEGGVPSKELMYRAGEHIKEAIDRLGLLEKSLVVIACGTGNNAGDGYVLASLLAKEDIPVIVYLAKEKFSEDGKYYYDKCTSENITIVKYPEFEIEDIDVSKALDVTEKYETKKSYKAENSGVKEYFSKEIEQVVVVDCLLGTGFKGVPREPISTVIRQINALREKNPETVKVVSIDINSGLNGDSGLGEIVVKSDVTISIGSLKSGLFLNKAKDYIGTIINEDIGIKPLKKPFYLVENIDVAKCLPERKNESNKGTYGYISLIGGSFRYSGASVLASNGAAAMRQGAGVVLLATPKSMAKYVIPKILECTIFPLSDNEGEVVFNEEELKELCGRSKVIAFGMGIGNTSETQKILEYLLCNYKGILIIDADGLNALSAMDNSILQKASCRRVILTPHVKEFERLLGAGDKEASSRITEGKESFGISHIKEDSINLARSYAKDNGVILLLKGPSTIVTNGEDVLITDRGCAGMATAGSGDVLSGILAAICGYNIKDGNTALADPQDENKQYEIEHLLLTVAAGAYINGAAGEKAQEKYGSISMIASDTISCIPEVIQKITE